MLSAFLAETEQAGWALIRRVCLQSPFFFLQLLDLFRLFWLTPFQSIRQDLKGKVLIPGMTRKMKRGQALQSSAMGSSFPYGRAVWLACDEEELR
ncbi:hypothetical protein V6N13_075669 [Hibiscus sabdariffa]|uniref:Uncharacterized protein n=1 Tax=Hibiscus sabdariffa TaxID=183260 RepID=A0ABR2UCK5_9ROSI